MRQKINFIGVYLVMFMVLGSAHAANVYLEWDFQDVEIREHSYIKFNGGAGTPCTDISGNGRDGTVFNSSVGGYGGFHIDRMCFPDVPKNPIYHPMIRVNSPYGDPNDPNSGNALYFRDEMCMQKVFREERTGLPAGVFDTGMTMRSVLVIDDPNVFSLTPSGYVINETSVNTTIFKYSLEEDWPQLGPDWWYRFWDTYPNPDTLWVLIYADSDPFELVIEPGDGSDPSFIARVLTDSPVNSGLVSVEVSRSALEAQLGFSVIGNPIVWTMTYSVAEQKLDLYANSELVGTASTTGSTSMNTGPGVWVIGNTFSNAQLYDGSGTHTCPASAWHWGINFKSVVDEVKVWDGGLTATEVVCDYGGVIGVLEPLPGDLGGDCRVNYSDHAIISDQWLLDCSDPNLPSFPDCYGADLDDSNDVGLPDIVIEADNWLRTAP